MPSASQILSTSSRNWKTGIGSYTTIQVCLKKNKGEEIMKKRSRTNTRISTRISTRTSTRISTEEEEDQVVEEVEAQVEEALEETTTPGEDGEDSEKSARRSTLGKK